MSESLRLSWENAASFRIREFVPGRYINSKVVTTLARPLSRDQRLAVGDGLDWPAVCDLAADAPLLDGD